MFLISLLELKFYMKTKELIIFTYTFVIPYYKPKKKKKRKCNISIEITIVSRKKSFLSLQNCLQFILKEKAPINP